MTYSSMRSGALLVLAAATLTLPSGAALNTFGLDFRINQVLRDEVRDAAIAMDAQGRYVVVWLDGLIQDESCCGRKVKGRRYDGNGNPLGEEFQINTNSSDLQGSGRTNEDPKVAMTPSGAFVVVWRGVSFAEPDNAGLDSILARRYDANGDPIGSDFEVAGIQWNFAPKPEVAVGVDGRFAVVWTDDNNNRVLVKRYDANGAALGAPAQVSISEETCGLGAVGDPDVVIHNDGRMTVAWQYKDPCAQTPWAIFARSYDAAGQPETGEVTVASNPQDGMPGNLTNAAVAAQPGGGFVVTWLNIAEGTLQGSNARLYDATSTPVTGIFPVAQFYPSFGGVNVASDAYGRFAVSIYGYPPTGPQQNTLSIRRFDAEGTALEDVILASERFDAVFGGSMQVATDADGNTAAAWVSTRTEAGSIDAKGLVASRRFAGFEDIDLSLEVADSPDPVALGETYDYTFTVTNHHAAVTPTGISPIDDAIGSAAGVRIGAELPAGVTFTSASGANWTCDGDVGFMGCQYEGALAPGASSSVTVTVTAEDCAGAATIAATVSGDLYDSVAANSSVNEGTEITGADTCPDAFSFTAVTGVESQVPITSNTVVISGIDAPAPISINAPSAYSINGGAFTSANGTIAAGDSLTLRTTSHPNAQTTTLTIVTIGNAISATWAVTTGSADCSATAFAFTDQTNRATGTEYVSNLVTVSGLTGPCGVGVDAGRYSKNGAAYTNANGTVNNGDTLRVRLFSSPDPNSTTNAVLTVGTTVDTFSITTGATDTTPAQFTFVDQTDIAPGTVLISSQITVTGITTAVPISVAGGTYRVNATGTYTNTPGTVNPGDTVRVRHTASPNPSTTVNTTLTVGGVSDTFSSTTNASDIHPSAFGFPTVFNVTPSTVVESAVITPTGYDAAAPVKANAGTEYRINGGAYTSSAGTINPGDTIQVRHTSAATANTLRTTSVRIGLTTGNFRTKTAP